jgi:hypothetical protein
VGVVEQGLGRPGRVAGQGVGAGRSPPAREAPWRGLAGDQDADAVEDLAHRQRADVEGHLAGLDLRQIEDVVDDAEQVLRRHADACQLGALAGARRIPQHDLGDAEDRVDRGADLMAHVGQELALDPAGRLGPGQGLAVEASSDRRSTPSWIELRRCALRPRAQTSIATA